MNIFVQAEEGYAYALGLVSGLRGKLLSGRDFESLAQAKGISDLLSQLEGTGYGARLKGLKHPFAYADVQTALDEAFLAAYVEVASAVPASDKAALDELMLGGWDVQNIKAVSRALRALAKDSDVLGVCFPKGRLEIPELRNLSDSSSYEEMPKKIRQPYSTLISDALARSSNQAEFEEGLDRGFMEGILSHSTPQMRKYVGLAVDALNIRAIVRCKMAGVEPDKHLLKGGHHMADNKLSQLLRQDLHGLAKFLEDTPYGKALHDLQSERQENRMFALERRLTQVVDSEVEYDSILNPHGISTVIAYVRAKEAEARKVRALVAGVWFGLPPDELKVMLG